MTALTEHRREYMRLYQKRRLAGLHTLHVDDIGPDANTLLKRYRKQSGVLLKTIVSEALIAYLTPKVQ